MARLLSLTLVVTATGCWAGWAPFDPPQDSASTPAAPPSSTSPPPHPSPSAAPVASSPTNGPVEAEVLEAAGNAPSLRGWTLVPYAQFQRGDRVALLLWPAFDDSGRLARASVVGLTFARAADGRLVPQGEHWPAGDSQSTPARLTDQLGSADYSVRLRGEGVPIDQLDDQLTARCDGFSAAARQGDRRAAVEEAIALSQLLSLDQVVFETSASHLLSLCANGTRVWLAGEVSPRGSRAAVRLQLRRGPSRQRLDGGAHQVADQPNRWVLYGLQWGQN